VLGEGWTPMGGGAGVPGLEAIFSRHARNARPSHSGESISKYWNPGNVAPAAVSRSGALTSRCAARDGLCSASKRAAQKSRLTGSSACRRSPHLCDDSQTPGKLFFFEKSSWISGAGCCEAILRRLAAADAGWSPQHCCQQELLSRTAVGPIPAASCSQQSTRPE
jgi:hypothetical protein